MMFNIDDKVGVIGHNEPRGTVGFIHGMLLTPTNSPIPRYTLKENKNSNVQGIFENKSYAENELVLVHEKPHHFCEFDFTQYLSEDQIKAIAEKVCEKQMTEYVDQILRNRTDGFAGGIVDQILHATAKIYTDKFSSRFEEAFSKRCHEEIWRDSPITQDEQTFRSSLTWELQKVAQKYIETNTDLIQSEMKDTIHNQAQLISGDKFSYMIGQKIDIKNIINQVLMETTTKPNIVSKEDFQEAQQKVLDTTSTALSESLTYVVPAE